MFITKTLPLQASTPGEREGGRDAWMYEDRCGSGMRIGVYACMYVELEAFHSHEYKLICVDDEV